MFRVAKGQDEELRDDSSQPRLRANWRLPICGATLALTGSDVPLLSLAARSRAWVTSQCPVSAGRAGNWRPYPQNDGVQDQAVVLAALRARRIAFGSHGARASTVGGGIGRRAAGMARLETVGYDANHGGGARDRRRFMLSAVR